MESLGDARDVSHPQWLLSEQLPYLDASLCLCRLQMLEPGSSDPVDPVEFFYHPSRLGQMPTLDGGGYPGHLTRVGMSQALRLGNTFRERYVDQDADATEAVSPGRLLPNSWGKAQPHVSPRSTLVERTVFTAGGVLSGLFPADAAVGMSAEIALNVALHDDKDEFMVLNVARCPRLRSLFAQGMQLTSEHYEPDQRRCIEHVEKGADWFVRSPQWKLIAYRDQYACRLADGKPIPQRVASISEELEAGAAKQMHAIFQGGAHLATDRAADAEAMRVQALRLGIGRLVHHILRTMEEPDGCLHLYSGHDWTVTPLLMCCARHDDAALASWPPFCSEISFELLGPRQPSGTTTSERERERFVRVVYNGSALDLPCSPRGQTLCSLRDFREMMGRFAVSPAEFDRECSATGKLRGVSGDARKIY